MPLSFTTQYLETQKAFRSFILLKYFARATALEARNKIKPSAFNPVLLNK